MRKLVLLPWLLLAYIFASSCNSNNVILRAKVIEDRAELIGGPVAMTDVGDFILENDQIRVGILRSIDSPGPGVFGGSVVDMDRRRPFIGFEGANGRDRFAETFPIANLMVPEPESVDIRVLEDGSNGKEAIVRVEGDGEFLFEALAILRNKQALLDVLFPDVRARLHFSTDYILRPGARHMVARTTLTLDDEQLTGCPPLSCANECPYGRAQDDGGCLVCECSDLLELENYTEPVSVFGRILGDNPGEAEAVLRAGVIAGDFVFFGNQNDVFAPGPGFDEDQAVQAAFNEGRNTFQTPLTYDFVAAAGGDVSYGYFTVRQEGRTLEPIVNVPLFASAATTFLASGVNCAYDAADDAACDQHRAWSFERYFVVGDGDIASVAEEVYRVRGIPTGELTGHVLWAETGEPVANANLYVFAQPEAGRDWDDLDQLVDANLRDRGDVGLLNSADADVGLDPQEDGDFRIVLPAGEYVVVARSPDGASLSAPATLTVAVDEQTQWVPSLLAPATLRVRVTDQNGTAMPAKVTLVSLDDDGEPLRGDAKRRPYLGDGRLGNGIRTLRLAPTGEDESQVEPGRYQIIASRGPEYGLAVENDVTLRPGGLFEFDAVVPHEIDSTGWMSIDMHLHSTPSFDSGLPVPIRVSAAAAEGVEIAVSTDHDVATDYRPTIKELGMEPFIQAAVGAEITTLEQGHFIGFPLDYDELTVPTHGAHDWTCQPGQDIINGIRAIGDGIEPFTIVAHPRDGFFGYIDQLGVDTYTMNRTPSLLEEDNPVFRIAGCDFDGMEIISAKRLDLHRTPSVGEMVGWTKCLRRINLAQTVEELTAACPELTDQLLEPCDEGERFAECRNRNRTRVAWEYTKLMLERTPAEQVADTKWPLTMVDSQNLCDPEQYDGPVPPERYDLPCSYRPGQVDDFFRLVDRGIAPTQIGSSDSHGASKEPGSPRTYFMAAADRPSDVAITDVVETLRAGHAFATYGPFVRASVAGKTFGETASLSAGSELVLELDVLTASWFGVDRVEIYLNGQLVRVLSPDSRPEDIEDVRGKVTLTVPDRDSHLVIIAMGLKNENLMRPVVVDIPFGEAQLSKIAADAFSRVPVVNELFAAPPTVPDWAPIAPYAFTNPIYIDVDGNGRFDPPLPLPEFCSRPCDPSSTDPDQCPSGQTCLDGERLCGINIGGRCDRRVAPGYGH